MKIGITEISPTPRDVTASGIIIPLTANESQAFGDSCYINSSGKAALSSASAITTASAVVLNVGPGKYLLHGIARNDVWNWTVGGLIYLSTTGTTGNTLTQIAPSGVNECIVVIGIATHSDRMYFFPQLVIVEHV
jgi:hypothetical protein